MYNTNHHIYKYWIIQVHPAKEFSRINYQYNTYATKNYQYYFLSRTTQEL